MKHTHRSTRLTAGMLLLTFVLSFALPTIVLAEDSIPAEPTVPAEAPAAPVEEPAAPVEAPVAPTEEAALPTEAPTAPAEVPAAPIEEATALEDLSQIPADTAVVVTGADGELLALGTQAAADVILASDPMWCPVGAGTCYQNTTLSGLISDMTTAGILGIAGSASGTMYFTDYTANDLTFDNSATGGLYGLGSLVIQGGWDGTGTTKPTITDGVTSTFNHTLTINNWTGNVSIYDIALIANTDNNGANTNQGLLVGAGSAISGITGNLTIADTSATQTTYGFEIFDTTGNITVTDSEFYQTHEGSLAENVQGNVAISGSQFNDNNGEGLSVGVSGGGQTNSFAITNTTFNGNAYDGLDIFEMDANINRNVTLDGVTASGNGTEGDTYDGVGVWIEGLTGTVGLTGTTVEGNYAAGLVIQHASTVTITDSSVSGNNLAASGWDNEDDLYDNTNLIYDAHDVTITNSHFDDNGYFLDLDSESYTYNEYVQEYGFGLIIDWGQAFYNDWDCGEGGCFTASDVYEGAAIHTPGDITIQGHLSGVTSTNTTTFSNNAFGGLYIGGEVWDGTAEWDGYSWEQSYVPYALGTLSISDAVFNDNDYFENVGGAGLAVYDLYANVTLTDIEAATDKDLTDEDIVESGNYGNGGDGIEIGSLYSQSTSIAGDETTYTYSYGTVDLDTITANYNWGGGVDIGYIGAVTAEDITTNENEYEGFYINDVYSTVSEVYDSETEYWDNYYTYDTVDLTDITVNWNDDNGLYIGDTGAVTGTDITAFENDGNGISIDGVYLTSSEVYDSGFGDWVYEDAYGAIDLTGITANGNSSSGMDFEYTGDVTISDESEAMDNICEGITMATVGNVTLSDITATGNGWYDYCGGLYIYDAGEVTINKNSSFNNNMAFGISIDEADDVNFNNVKANQNGYYGEDETDESADGIYLEDIYGDFTASKVTASGNLGDGLYMAYVHGDATISDSTFNNNDSNGIYYSSQSYQSGGVGEGGLTTRFLGGNVYLTNVTVEGNGRDGADLYVNGNLEISCSSFKNNGDFAISAGVDGNATFMGVSTTGEVRVKVNGEFIELTGCQKVGGAAEGSESGMGYKQGVGDDSQVSFSCDSYLGLQLTLPLGDFVKIPCGPNGSTGDYSASALSLAEGSLPAAPAGTFISAFEFTISDAQYAGSILVSFKLEAGESTEGYQIMFWDGTTWVSVGGAQVGDYFQGWVSQPGIYALVKN